MNTKKIIAKGDYVFTRERTGDHVWESVDKFAWLGIERAE